MKQEIKLRYLNQELKIGLVSWKEAYLLNELITPLKIEVYKGRIVYRGKGSAKRISYNRLKKGLIKRNQVILVYAPSWLSEKYPETSPKMRNPHLT
jgi:hypothetical protein